MIRSTALRPRLVPVPPGSDLPQEPLPGLARGGAPGELGAAVAPVAPVAPAARPEGPGRLRLVGARARVERGMATAEYAVGLVAACAFALVLYKLVTSTKIFELLEAVAERALTFVAP